MGCIPLSVNELPLVSDGKFRMQGRCNAGEGTARLSIPSRPIIDSTPRGAERYCENRPINSP